MNAPLRSRLLRRAFTPSAQCDEQKAVLEPSGPTDNPGVADQCKVAITYNADALDYALRAATDDYQRVMESCTVIDQKATVLLGLAAPALALLLQAQSILPPERHWVSNNGTTDERNHAGAVVYSRGVRHGSWG